MKKVALTAGIGVISLFLAGCATPPPDDDPEAKAEFEQINDPLEPTNRAIFDFNDKLDTYFLKPVAQGYRYVVPQFGRDRVRDFLANLSTPLVFGNDLLEGKVVRAGTTLERFVLNMTFGVLGVMDVATPMGIPAHNADFGQTFAIWGVPEGPYLVVPLFGPSDPRDLSGMIAEMYTDPLDYILADQYWKWVSYTRTGIWAVSKREQFLDPLDDIKRNSLDYYSAMRSLYRQRRNSDIDAARKAD